VQLLTIVIPTAQSYLVMMKAVSHISATITLLMTVPVSAFAPNNAYENAQSLTTVLKMVYVPSGFTEESYRKFKEDEKKKALAKKNLGGLGPRGFKSRSMQSFQEAMERGDATHLMPVFNAKEKVNSGKLKMEDIPYMQRGGSWDNSDVKGAKKKRWLQSDQEYSSGGYKKEQSVSIFGYGNGLDWTGKRSKTGPSAGEVSVKKTSLPKNYKPPTVTDAKPKKKGWFGF